MIRRFSPTARSLVRSATCFASPCGLIQNISAANSGSLLLIVTAFVFTKELSSGSSIAVIGDVIS
ncbi:hypothetical protein MGWOODY_Mmi1876 [hydrothermal vent metagenome]|uniref:Uncharacterized protein n=1 Tax=hydrothermal vent metagenome TaxID=652676 RepID=A0A160VF10_9ZZZZ